MSITLGVAPQRLEVILTKDADFFTTLRNADGDWSSTAQIQLRLGSITVNAVINGADATISMDDEQVNSVYASRINRAKLFYVDGETEICWAIGSVTRSV